MKKVYSILFLVLILYSYIHAQNIFNDVYPIGETPNIGWKSQIVSNENILFEANPILRMSLYNDVREQFQSNANYAEAWYLSFRPQLRMYNENSMPVKTPSYKISILGTQHIFKIDNKNFLGFSLESGHYSNGQSMCAFDESIADGTPQSDSVYSSITPQTNLSDKLNRRSANFSTNYTEFIVNYRKILEEDNEFKANRMLSIKAGINHYHNNLLWLIPGIGGYSENDIMIYGRNRFLFGIEYTFKFKWLTKKDNCICFCDNGDAIIDRVSLTSNLEYISIPHPSVNPTRLDVTMTFYFKNNLGFFASFITGHDNYNYRFVDSGTHFFSGITFDIFPPIQLHGVTPK